MAYYSAGQALTAALLLGALPFGPIKQVDESVNNAGTGTTLQNDNELLAAVTANTNYKVDLHLFAVEAAGTGIDMKAAWTFPSGCLLDLAVVAPQAGWQNPIGTNLEAEWAAWQGVTTSPTASITFGTTNAATFSYHVRGTLRVGTAGTLQLQWAQANSNAANLTVRSGSSLILTPLLT